MSNSVQPQRQQPTRLHRLWDSPGKNTGVGCHFLLQCRKVKSESEVAQSCPTLSNPMDCSLPGSSAHGIFQATVLEWGAIAFSLLAYSGKESEKEYIYIYIYMHKWITLPLETQHCKSIILQFFKKKFISRHFRLPLTSCLDSRMPKALFITNHALPSTDISEKEEVAYGKEGHGALGWSETFFSFLFFFPRYFQFNNLAIPLRLPCAQHWMTY